MRVAAGVSSVSEPSPAALRVITLAENRTELSVPLSETESMLPQRATRVIAIMRMDHSKAGSVVSPSNSLNRPGATRSSIALSPKTVAPVASTLRR